MQKHPNLVIVFPDQMRGQALGFLKEDPVVTPHLDRFAEESLVLTQAVSNYPVCSPFRASLMTGMYPISNGVIGNCNNHNEPLGCELRKEDTCWSDVLQSKGYSLGYIGKWHLDSPRSPYIDCENNRGEKKWNEWCPPDRRHGFDYWYSYGTYDHHMNPLYWRTDAAREEFHYVDQWGPEHEADRAIAYIQNKQGEHHKPDRPFALVVSMNPPHTPYTEFPDRYLKAYEGKSSEDLLVRPNVDASGDSEMSKLALEHTKNYFANVTGVDEQFGRIVRAIDDAGLKNDTIVLFMSDHGDCIGAHNQPSKNNPYEESMRIPFLIRWPGKIKPGRDDLLLSSPDIYPTLLDLMGFVGSIPESVEGTSHAAIFRGDPGPRPSSQLYLHMTGGLRGVRTHRYKLVLTPAPDGSPEHTLYDLKQDPYELTNVANEHREVVHQLIREELHPWLEKTGDRFGWV